MKILCGIVAAFAVACGSSVPQHPTDDRVRQLKTGAPATPDGKQIGTLGSNLHLRDRGNRFGWHGGPVMHGTPQIYLIWYGTWPDPNRKALIADLIANLGGSAYYAINAGYSDGADAIANSVQYAGSVDAPTYPAGISLTDLDVASIAPIAIANGWLPLDSSGIYFILGSADVNVTSGLCTSYCALHSLTTLNGIIIQYAFVGDPSRCASACVPQATGPNGDGATDAMASLVAAEISDTVTDPHLSSWYDRRGFEGADKCAWTYGTTYTAANGALANVHLGTRDYLLQQLWVNDAGGGHCALAVP